MSRQPDAAFSRISGTPAFGSTCVARFSRPAEGPGLNTGLRSIIRLLIPTSKRKCGLRRSVPARKSSADDILRGGDGNTPEMKMLIYSQFFVSSIGGVKTIVKSIAVVIHDHLFHCWDREIYV